MTIPGRSLSSRNRRERRASRRSKPSRHIAFQKRIRQQTFEYDWLGINDKTTDGASGFYDRSLGDISNDSSSGNPYQLKSATLPGDGGSLEARYDAAGNMIKMALLRESQCLGGATTAIAISGSPQECP